MSTRIVSLCDICHQPFEKGQEVVGLYRLNEGKEDRWLVGFVIEELDGPTLPTAEWIDVIVHGGCLTKRGKRIGTLPGGLG